VPLCFASASIEFCWTHLGSLSELWRIKDFRCFECHFLIFFRELLFHLIEQSAEDVLQVLILFCLELLESDRVLLYSERHTLLRVLPVLVILAMSGEKEGESFLKKIKLSRLVRVFRVPSAPCGCLAQREGGWGVCWWLINFYWVKVARVVILECHILFFWVTEVACTLCPLGGPSDSCIPWPAFGTSKHSEGAGTIFSKSLGICATNGLATAPRAQPPWSFRISTLNSLSLPLTVLWQLQSYFVLSSKSFRSIGSPLSLNQLWSLILLGVALESEHWMGWQQLKDFKQIKKQPWKSGGI